MIRRLFEKYRELVMYGIFGVLTTLINLLVFFLLSRALPGRVSVLVPNTIAWVAGVLFAYVTNRKWVFASRAAGRAAVLRELGSFVAARLVSGLMDSAIMFVAVDVMHFDEFLIKILSNILVIILNYLFSKFLVFRKKTQPD